MYDVAVEEVDGRLMASSGDVPYSRRLADKLLAAFNFAYAVGEAEIAAQVRELLARLDGADGAFGEERRQRPLNVEQADLWIAFVEARNKYRFLCAVDPSDEQNCEPALAAMRDAYRAWTFA